MSNCMFLSEYRPTFSQKSQVIRYGCSHHVADIDMTFDIKRLKLSPSVYTNTIMVYDITGL